MEGGQVCTDIDSPRSDSRMTCCSSFISLSNSCTKKHGVPEDTLNNAHCPCVHGGSEIRLLRGNKRPEKRTQEDALVHS